MVFVVFISKTHVSAIKCEINAWTWSNEFLCALKSACRERRTKGMSRVIPHPKMWNFVDRWHCLPISLSFSHIMYEFQWAESNAQRWNICWMRSKLHRVFGVFECICILWFGLRKWVLFIPNHKSDASYFFFAVYFVPLFHSLCISSVSLSCWLMQIIMIGP